MGRRRVHSKSRYGCDLCKKRRVKCDEVHPTCTTCAMRDDECHYSRVLGKSPLSSSIHSDPGDWQPTISESHSPPSCRTPPVPPAIDNRASLTPEDDFAASMRRRELELMHFWFMRTSQSFTSDLGDLFRNDVVKAALEHEYLTDYMFALTSLHIASETDDAATIASYVRIALQYQDNALPPFRAAMDNITKVNCFPIFVSSLLSMACSVVAPFLDNMHEKKPGCSSPTGGVLALYHFISGIGSVVGVSREWLQEGPYRFIWGLRQQRLLLRPEMAASAATQLRHLNDMVTRIAQPSLHQMYENAITCMEESFGANNTMGISWLYLTGKDFAAELQREDPIALVILMHWGVLLCKLNEMWWAIFYGRKLVEEVCEMLDQHGEQWWEAKAWARNELEL